MATCGGGDATCGQGEEDQACVQRRGKRPINYQVVPHCLCGKPSDYWDLIFGFLLEEGVVVEPNFCFHIPNLEFLGIKY